MPRFLIIQTAFIGDVVLATALIEKLHAFYPGATIDFMLRKGNEGLLTGNSKVRKVWVWDKKKQKIRNLLGLAMSIRREKYDYVINPHRFATSGIVTLLSGAENRIGFDKNPLSFCYTKTIKHLISAPYDPAPIHETQRNQMLIAGITDATPAWPALYPSEADFEKVAQWQKEPYVCIAPSSVWFTKQFPVQKWINLLDEMPANYNVYLLGGPDDSAIAAEIINGTGNKKVTSLCGQLNFLQSAALMKGAAMNYVNDSAPLHFCSAVAAPVTAVYCSTVPAFGFGPVRSNGRIVEIAERLYCRPCGLHGRKTCPEGHFRCAMDITNQQLLEWTSNTI
ncbi:glycosyltransferase family 9 protein [Chitinophagaceae bacterium MMS25-I14]